MLLPRRITKAVPDDEMAFPFVFQEGQYGVSNVFIGQPAIIVVHTVAACPVNIPLNDAEQQKWKLLLMNGTTDEVGKPLEFQEASINY